MDQDQDQDCPVCRAPLREPSRTRACSHVFCASCLRQALQERMHCPICRTPVDTRDIIPVPRVSRVRQAREAASRAFRILPSSDLTATIQPVSAGIQRRINQLRTSNSTDQTNPGPASSVAPPIFRPYQAPPQSTTPIPAVFFSPQSSAPPLHPSLASVLLADVDSSEDEDEEDDMQELMDERALLDHNGPRRLNEMMVFTCPYCNEGGLDELDMLDHCNNNHHHDNRSVVCPICVSLPHGDPNYHSRNFIGHLNLRHNYYHQDITDINQSDAMNEQAALLDSYKTLSQKPA
ncbi:E3 ubiquitin-protein ligase RNF138 [Denticeps clupeoides]|uniref:E3 ubiquitin-protein ligase RNF166 n=1 Tax=Denticeps clupeoides TaxID=299321 RepID=A0AAY4CPL4_9TELE|nr:E3 ubiquitin-protein ligase RNF138-like [Denticeps clupeoides]XP_028817489.1 E3 ubiquitin-protein ligase RNF138-like [Denticeps clupeoides]